MPLFAPLPRAAGVRELLDGPVPFRDLVRSLGDVARLNGVFGGRLVTLRHVRRLLARYPPDRPVTVLDVGTGSADIPRALVRWARRAGRSLRVIALDLDAATLAVARQATDGYGEITFVRADALALPFRPESVDLAISALTLHHLEPAAAASYLAAMDAVARAGLVVNDLARSRTALILVWLATRVLACGRLSRHDGPLSVKRAYTPDEVRGLCARAGLRHVVIRRYAPLLRYCLVGGRGLAR